MSEFDKWYEENSWDIENYYDAEKAFKAGQQSQQNKIDELKNKYDTMYNAFVVADDCRKEWHESYMSARKERDEMQARIDATEKWIESNKKTIALEYSGYTTEEYVDADDLLDILKGNKNEKIIRIEQR